MTKHTGTETTREFYDTRGWREQDGESVDKAMFGVTEDGPIRVELHVAHFERIRAALRRAGEDLRLLECGCGGNPELQILDLCLEYVGVDFSESGLSMARSRLEPTGVPFRLETADACALPFEDASFDALYCAHMLYHIEDPRGQEEAIAEMIRVVRPGGVLVLLVVNPRPLLFPVRMIRRLMADAPLVGAVADKLRSKPPLPFRPMPRGWMRRRLGRGGRVEILTYWLPHTAFKRNVTEFRGLGRLRWRVIRWLDLHHPRVSAYLGNYVQFNVYRGDH
ncbi:MAG: class I SAM-dependent methyltransferase [Phycisphaerales bacterium]